MIIRSTYLAPLFKRYGTVLDCLCKAISKDLNSFDAIAFRGASGMMIAPMVAHTLKKDFILVRKELSEEKRHSYYELEGKETVSNYIIIDDGIDEGNTINKILAAMKNRYRASFCYKIFLYNQYGINTDFRKDNYKKIPIVYT